MSSLNLETATLDALAGTWHLTGYGNITHNEVPGISHLEGAEWADALREKTNAWMDDHPEELPEVEPREGLTTTIDPNGTIQDSGEIDGMVYWDGDGVQGGDLFEGYLEDQDGRIIAFSSEHEPNDIQRYSDDGAYITDEFFRSGEDLVRVQSVVFDDMYLYRSVFQYGKA